MYIGHLNSISLVSHLVSHFVDLDKVRDKVRDKVSPILSGDDYLMVIALLFLITKKSVVLSS